MRHVEPKMTGLGHRVLPAYAEARIGWVLLVCAGFSVGCGGTEPMSQQSACTVETRADTYVQGLEKPGQHYTVTLLTALPGPPDRGENLWSLAIAQSQMPVETATVAAKPWMPDHGHGTTPMYHRARRTGEPGQYELGPMDLFMPGYWTVTLEVEQDLTQDQIVFGFCIEG